MLKHNGVTFWINIICDICKAYVWRQSEIVMNDRKKIL